MICAHEDFIGTGAAALGEGDLSGTLKKGLALNSKLRGSQRRLLLAPSPLSCRANPIQQRMAGRPAGGRGNERRARFNACLFQGRRNTRPSGETTGRRDAHQYG